MPEHVPAGGSDQIFGFPRFRISREFGNLWIPEQWNVGFRGVLLLAAPGVDGFAGFMKCTSYAGFHEVRKLRGLRIS